MENHQFLQRLCELSLEEGKVFVREHAAELQDHASFGELLADEALRILYTPFVSLKLAELLIFFGEYTAHLSSHALGLKAKGDALVQIGHFQAAMECLDVARDEFLSLGDEGNAARSQISWIVACTWLGRVEEALREATHAHDVFVRLGERYWVCVIDHNIAWIYTQSGRYNDALDLYKRMLALYPTLTDQSEASIKRSIGLAEMNQAVHLAWLGNFEQAYRLQHQALASFVALEEVVLIAHSEVNLADFNYAQGYYGSALRLYYRACDSLIQNNIDDLPLLAKLKLWIAKCLVKLNRAQEASLLASEGVEMERRFGISLNTGYILREYATILVISSRLKEALDVLDDALTIFNERGIDHQATSTKLYQAELLLKMGFLEDAYRYASSVKEYFEGQSLISYASRASLVMADALIGQAIRAGERQEKEQQAILLKEAMSLLKQIAVQAHQYNLQEDLYKSHYFLGRIWVLQGNMIKAARQYSAAIAQIERILNDLVYDLSPAFLHATWTVYEDMIALCLQQGQSERAFNYLEQARSMALRQYINKQQALQDRRREQEEVISQSTSAAMLRMQQELANWQERYRDYSVMLAGIDTSVSTAVDQKVIQTELKRCEVKISELFERLSLYQSGTPLKSDTKKPTQYHVKHLDITQLRQQLAPHQLLLAYFLYKGRLVIFAATRDRLVTYENPDGKAELEVLFALLHDAHLRPEGWPNILQPPQQAIRRLLNKLYKLLIAPVAEMLPSPSGALTIVPYGPLHKLPFHALHDGSHFLIENFQINYLPATNMLMHFNSQKDEQEQSVTDTSKLVKPPLVFGYSGNGSLQHTLDEVKVLAEMLKGQCYLEDDATIARLIEKAPGSPIIHIATHGQNRLDAPNFSYVLLVDGQLNAIDAFNLDLRNCELVTLSGCETGLALSSGGDEQLGLGRAFLAAGAKSLVMSLWSVEDNATNELMRCFYQHLLNGESKVQALRAAQCELLHSMSSNYAHPYFWAAFRLVGDVSPLKSKKQDTVLATSLFNC